MDSKTLRAIGFQNWLKDAEPEEVANALEQIERGGADKDADRDNPIPTFDPEAILEGTREPVLSVLDIRQIFEEEQKPSVPTVVSFFNGRTFEEGVAAYNEYLISKGDK
jgi:hypothetical protein